MMNAALGTADTVAVAGEITAVAHGTQRGLESVALRLTARRSSAAADRALLGVLCGALVTARVSGRPAAGLDTAYKSVRARIVRATGTWQGLTAEVR